MPGSLLLLIMLLPVYMFSVAVTFNISKWVFFLVKTEESINLDQEQYQKKNRRITIATIIIISVISTVYGYVFIAFLVNSDNE